MPGLDRILIVGGGVAGWMSAAYLNRVLRRTGCHVTVLDSVAPDLAEPLAGGPVFQFLSALRLEEAAFMRQANATYRLATQFSDWIKPNRSFWHTNGSNGTTIDGLDLFHFWLKAVRSGYDKGPFSRYSLPVLLSELGKAPRPLEGKSPLLEDGSVSYHLDAAALTDFLRTLAIGEGVEQVFDDAIGAVVDPRGYIQEVRTAHGRTFKAALYLDCTGSAAKLISGVLDDPWVDWSPWLQVNESVHLRLPRDEKMPPFTGITAEPAGWSWQSPLSHRQQWGYAFAGNQVTADEAAQVLERRAEAQFSLKGRGAEITHHTFRPGRRERFWSGNCVAIGASAGYLEPLAAPLVLFIQRSLGLLLDHFPDAECHPALSRAYNEHMGQAYDAARDFTIVHYLVSQRAEPFWRQAREVHVPSDLRWKLELYLENGRLDPGLLTLFPESAWYGLLGAGDDLPRCHAARADVSDFEKVRPLFEKIRLQNEAVAKDLPSHLELMEWVHRPPL